MAVEDFVRLRQQGLNLPQIVAILSKKYDYDLKGAVKSGKKPNEILSELINLKPKSSNIFTAIPLGLARGVFIDLPELVNQAVGIVSPQVEKTIEKSYLEPLKKRYAQVRPNYRAIPSLLEESAAILGPSWIPAGILGTAGTSIARLMKIAEPIETGIKAAEIGVPTLFGLAEVGRALDKTKKMDLPDFTRYSYALLQGLIEGFGEYLGTRAFLHLFGYKNLRLPRQIENALKTTGIEPGTFREKVLNLLKRGVKSDLLKTSIIEGGTESLQDLGHAIVGNAYGVEPQTVKQILQAGAAPFLPAALSPLFGLPYMGMGRKVETPPKEMPPGMARRVTPPPEREPISWLRKTYSTLGTKEKTILRADLLFRGFKEDEITDSLMRAELLFRKIAEKFGDDAAEDYKPSPGKFPAITARRAPKFQPLTPAVERVETPPIDIINEGNVEEKTKREIQKSLPTPPERDLPSPLRELPPSPQDTSILPSPPQPPLSPGGGGSVTLLPPMSESTEVTTPAERQTVKGKEKKPNRVVIPNKRFSDLSRARNPKAWKVIEVPSKDVPLTDKAVKNWEKNKSSVGYASFYGLSTRDIASIFNESRKGNVVFGVDRWGRASSYKLIERPVAQVMKEKTKKEEPKSKINDLIDRYKEIDASGDRQFEKREKLNKVYKEIRDHFYREVDKLAPELSKEDKNMISGIAANDAIQFYPEYAYKYSIPADIKRLRERKIKSTVEESAPIAKERKLKAPSEYFIVEKNGVSPVRGKVYPFIMFGHTFFAYKEKGKWGVAEKRTGLSVVQRTYPTKREAIEKAKSRIEEQGKQRLDRVVEENSKNIIPFIETEVTTKKEQQVTIPQSIRDKVARDLANKDLTDKELKDYANKNNLPYTYIKPAYEEMRGKEINKPSRGPAERDIDKMFDELFSKKKEQRKRPGRKMKEEAENRIQTHWLNRMEKIAREIENPLAKEDIGRLTSEYDTMQAAFTDFPTYLVITEQLPLEGTDFGGGNMLDGRRLSVAYYADENVAIFQVLPVPTKEPVREIEPARIVATDDFTPEETDLLEKLVGMGIDIENMTEEEIRANIITSPGEVSRVYNSLQSRVKEGTVKSLLDRIRHTLNDRGNYISQFFTGAAQERYIRWRERLTKKINPKHIALSIDKKEHVLSLIPLEVVGQASIFDPLKTEVERKIEYFVSKILGSNIKVEVMDYESMFHRLTDDLGMTLDDLRTSFAKHGMNIPEGASFEEMLRSIRGLAIPLDIKKAMILINYDFISGGDKTMLRTAFHEIMEVLTHAGYLSETDIGLLRSKFGGRGKAWTERAADAFAEFMVEAHKRDMGIDENKPLSTIQKIFAKIKEFLNKIGNYIRGLGFRTEKDLFRAIERGKYKERKRPVELDDDIEGKLFASIDKDKLVSWTHPISEEDFVQKFQDNIDNIIKAFKLRVKDKKVSIITKYLLNPQWTSKHPIMRTVFDIMKNTQHWANAKVYELTNEILPEIKDIKRDKQRWRSFRDAIVVSDMANYRFSEDELRDLFNFDDDMIRTYDNYKATMDKTIKIMLDRLRDNELVLVAHAFKYESLSADFISKTIDRIVDRIEEIKTMISSSIAAEDPKVAEKPRSKKYRQMFREQLQSFINEGYFGKIPKGKEDLASEFINDIVSRVNYYHGLYTGYTKGFYFPRVRPAGRYAVKVYESVETTDPETGATRREWIEILRYQTKPLPKTLELTQLQQIIKREAKRFKDKAIILKDKEEMEKYLGNTDRILIVPEEIVRPAPEFYDRVSNTAVMNYVETMIARMREQNKNKEEDYRLATHLLQQIRNDLDTDLKARSRARARFIKRRGGKVDIDALLRDEPRGYGVVGGYETNVYDVSRDYIISMMNSVARMMAVSDINQYTSEPTIKDQLIRDTNLYSWFKGYTDSVMYASSPIMRYSAALRAVISSWYLGFRTSSAFIQLTQGYITGAAELATFEDALARDLEVYRPKKRGIKEIDAIVARHLKSIGRITSGYYNIFKALATGEGLTRDEKSALKEGLRRGILYSEYINSLREEAGTVLPRWMMKYVDTSFWLFQKAERLSREAGFVAAYRLAKEKGLNYQQSLEFASKFVEQAFHIYTNINRPLIALKKEWAPLISLLVTLRGYQLNYLGWAYHAISNEHGEVFADKLAASVLYNMILGGVFAAPLLGELIKLLGKIFGWERDPEKELSNFISKNIHPSVGRAVEFGIAAPIFKADLSGSIRMDFLPRDPSFTGVIDAILGVWRSAGYKTTNLWESWKRGDLLASLEAISPVFFENISKTVRHELLGQPWRTRTGVMLRTAAGQPIKLSNAEKSLMLFGFRPITLSEQSSIYRATRTIERYYSRKRNTIYEKLRFADSYEDLPKIMQKINEYNLKAIKYGGVIPIITPDSIFRVLRNAQGEPNRLALLVYG
jgi:hypothetical protein